MIKPLFVITLLSMGLLATVNDIRVKVEYGHFLWVVKKAVFSLDQRTDASADFQDLKAAGSVSKWYVWANYFGKLSKAAAAEEPVYGVTYLVAVDKKEAVSVPAALTSSEAGKPIYFEGHSVLGLCANDAVKEVKLDNVKFDGTKTFLVSVKVVCAAPAEEKTEPTPNPNPNDSAPEQRIIL